MIKKTWTCLMFMALFILAAGSSFAAVNIVYDGGRGWTQGSSDGATVVMPTSNSCGYDGKMRYAYGTGSGSHFWGQWANPGYDPSEDSMWQYSVYIPGCNTSAKVKYEVWRGYSKSEVSIDQNQYSNDWVSLGTFFIPGSNQGGESKIRLTTSGVSNVLTVGWDEAQFSNN